MTTAVTFDRCSGMKCRVIFLAIPLLLQSCSSMYIPAVRSIPLFEKKGEFQGEAGVSTNSVYVNSSYAFTNHIAASINGNLSYRNFSDRYDLFTDIYEAPPSTGGFGFDFSIDTRGKFAHRYGEVSVGKINMLSPFKIQKLEIFGGTGIGRATDIDYFEHSNHYKCNYYSFFIQGNFGLKKRVFETGGSLRIAYSKFKVAANIYVNSSEDYLYRNNFNAFHFEPMGFTRIGNENLKIVFRYGINLPIPTSSIEKQTENSDIYFHNRLSFNFFHFSIGMSYRISGITKN